MANGFILARASGSRAGRIGDGLPPRENAMAATSESRIRTRAFARVIGPYLAIVPAIIAVRAPDMDQLASSFFALPALVWITGGLLVFAGLFIIAFHSIWSSLPAVLISLFGWFLALRGLVLLIAPGLMERAAVASTGAVLAVRLGFGLLVLIGLRLTYEGWFAAPAGGANDGEAKG
jgi:hypothetical protein